MAQEDKNVTIPPEMMQEIVRVASETAIEKFQHEAERNRKAVKDKRLHNTKLLLQNYRPRTHGTRPAPPPLRQSR